MSNFIKNNILLIALVFFLLVTTSGCSSDDNSSSIPDPGGTIGNTSVTMKVNGQNWSTNQAFAYTIPASEAEDEDEFSIQDGYLVYIHATRTVDDTPEGDEGETLGLYLHVSESQFENPKGNYNMGANGIENQGEAAALYLDYINNIYYGSGDVYGESNVFGSINVTDFKIGKQYVYGDGYLELSGTFEMDMYGANYITGEDELIQIRDGKFKVYHSILYE